MMIGQARQCEHKARRQGRTRRHQMAHLPCCGGRQTRPRQRRIFFTKRLNILKTEHTVAMAISDVSETSRPLSVRAFAEAAETSPRRIRRLIRQGRLLTVENQA